MIVLQVFLRCGCLELWKRPSVWLAECSCAITISHSPPMQNVYYFFFILFFSLGRIWPSKRQVLPRFSAMSPHSSSSTAYWPNDVLICGIILVLLTRFLGHVLLRFLLSHNPYSILFMNFFFLSTIQEKQRALCRSCWWPPRFANLDSIWAYLSEIRLWVVLPEDPVCKKFQCLTRCDASGSRLYVYLLICEIWWLWPFHLKLG